METLGIDVEWENKVVLNSVSTSTLSKFKSLKLRNYQQKAQDTMISASQGIYQSPPGSGKTVTMIGTIAKLQQKSLIIVNRINLATQWADRFEQHLGYRPSIIGDSKWEESDITIALQQTLHAKCDELDYDWYSQWGLVCLDECHSLPALTVHRTIEQFPAQYRFGLSATPKKTGEFMISEVTVGPIIHITPKAPLREHGILVKPIVKIVPTGFFRNYKPTEKRGKKVFRNNYESILSDLVKDYDRNHLIAKHLSSLRGNCVLVNSKRLIQLHHLREICHVRGWPNEKLLMMTGKESSEERQEVYRRADLGDCIIFSTISDEAVDIPRIDVVALVYPIKNTDFIIQLIGRGERSHPEKNGFTILDFVDYGVAPIKNQFMTRKREVYIAEGISTERVK